MTSRTLLTIGGLVAAAAITVSASEADAKGTYFLVEMGAGVGESAYSASAPGLNYGASAGVTFRIPSTPLRWYLLGTVVGRNASAAGTHQGLSFFADRRDVDLYLANRIVVPVWRMIRVFGELGLGQRFFTQSIERSEGLGILTESSSRFLLVAAVGVQARLTKRFSVGLRAEMTPLGGGGPELAPLAADLSLVENRISAMATLGVHF